MNEMISVVVPVYKTESYLTKCVDSILAQTYKELEVILVDDGSPDGSGALCDDYKARDDRIKVVHKANGGLSSARNAGIDVATGSYISFVDSDDFIEPDMYEAMYQLMQKQKAQICVSGRYVVFDDRTEEVFVSAEQLTFSSKNASRRVLTYDKMDSSFCDKLFQTSLFQDVRFPEGQICEDIAIIYRILRRAQTVVHVGKPMYHYIQRSSSISNSKMSRARLDLLKSADQLRQEVLKDYPDLQAEADGFYYRAMIHLLGDIAISHGNELAREQKQMLSQLRRKEFSILTNGSMDRRYRLKSILLCFGLYNVIYKFMKT